MIEEEENIFPGRMHLHLSMEQYEALKDLIPIGMRYLFETQIQKILMENHRSIAQFLRAELDNSLQNFADGSGNIVE